MANRHFSVDYEHQQTHRDIAKEEVMAGERLFKFDCDLCEYVLGNIRQYLLGVAKRPAPIPTSHTADRDLLDFPVWFSRELTGDMAALGDHVWSGVFGDAPRLPLNDAELYALAGAVDDVPMSLEKVCVWEPFPALHKQYIECIPEIQNALTRQTAEEWATACAGFAARLSDGQASLADGITVVREWLWCIRHLLRVMGAINHLPFPMGTHSTPMNSKLLAGSTVGVHVDHKQPVKPIRVGGRSVPKENREEVADPAICGWKEAMAITGLKKSKLYELFRRGVLSGYRDRAMIRFYRTGLLDYMKDRENAPAVTPPPVARKPRKVKTPTGVRFKYL